MGTKNRVTEAKYKEIKSFVTEQKLKGKTMKQIDAAVDKKFGFKASTSRSIRNTKDYQAYCERVFRFHGHPSKHPNYTHSKYTTNTQASKQVEERGDPDIVVLTVGRGTRSVIEIIERIVDVVTTIAYAATGIVLIIAGVVIIFKLIGA